MRARASTTTATLEDVDVECTHCRVRMTAHLGSGSKVRYFNCPSCHRWVSSVYPEVFRADAKVRTHPARAAAAAAFDQVKGRLDRWLAEREDQDPWRLLGVSPTDSPERVREAYREAALANHPDRGGSVERMRRINAAWEELASHRERRLAGLESGPVALESGL